MKKNRAAKAKRRRRVGLTRPELAADLGCSLRKIDRLIAAGLKPSGPRGNAKLYSLSDARRLARKLTPVELVATDILVQDYASHAADLRDRRQRLREAWVADWTWVPVWRELTSAVAREAGDCIVAWPAGRAHRQDPARGGPHALRRRRSARDPVSAVARLETC